VEAFDYCAPASVEEAVAALARPGARALAGGTDLLPQMSEGRRQVASVVDLKRVAEATAVEVAADGSIRIGAAASCARVARDPAIARDLPGLAEACRLVGSLQIQTRASLGGNVCNASPSADTTPILLALAAEVEVAGAGGRRRLALPDFVTGPGRTALAEGEMLVALHVPARAPRSAARYLRFTPRREMDIAIAGVAAALTLDDAGRVTAARLALAAVGPTVLEAGAAAAGLVGQAPDAALLVAAGKAAAAVARPISDTRASADYRRHLVEVLAARALAGCCADLGLTIDVP
jgi:CO/xanthine dehydrogenase FAD-binding subunit